MDVGVVGGMALPGWERANASEALAKLSTMAEASARIVLAK